jgi:signal transduction histidine kinase
MPWGPESFVPGPSSAWDLVPPRSPEAAGPEEAPLSGTDSEGVASRALRLVARREHELLALSELSQELTISLDLYGVADLVLFNLMGQLGTSRAALWLISEQDHRAPVLLRSHGVDRRMAAALGSACASWLLDRFESEPRIVLASEMVSESVSTTWLVRKEAIALFAPILSRGEILGFLAVGARVGGGGYGPVEMQSLQTSLGMVGVALHNTKLYNRLLENNRLLRLANENLMELDGLKSEFLNNVNHELRTPLTIVIASLQCLIENKKLEPETAEFLEVALGESQSLKGLLENLLDFSDATRNRLEFRIENGDVVAPLQAYFQERLPGVTHALRELVFQAAPDLPRVRFDRQRLTQIIDALVDNAVKFTSEGARIEIRATSAKDARDPRVRIEVTDDGPGIPPDRLHDLFDSFLQVDGSATRKVGGMGLGLAFARRLAEGMGGTLTVTSEVGVGSTFTLALPAV